MLRLAFAVVVLVVASACAALHPPGVASGARLASPTPTSTPANSTTQLSAPSTQVVWALVDYHDLYRSTDQGATWAQSSIPGQPGVRPVVSFIDDHEGWLLAPGSPTTQCDEANASVWHTTDAGKTWQQLPARGIVPAQCKNGIWFADAEHGLVSAWDDNHAATIYRTSDGGATWSAASLLPNPPNFQSASGGVGWQVTWMKLFGSDAFLAANGTPYIFESTDAGASWSWVTKTPTASVVVVTESRWLDFSDPRNPTVSVNGGQAFQPFTTDLKSDGDESRFVFADANVGYASGNGLLQRTTDGGVHWTRIASP